MKTLRSNEYGSMMILWAFLLPIVIGFIGLGVEVSVWYTQRTDMQSATDAAAIATAYYIGTGKSLSTIAMQEMARNHWGTSQNVSVTVHNPPLSGIYAGNPNAVEVIASHPEPLSFLKRFSSAASANITTRAVASSTPNSGPASGTACILALSTAGTNISSSGNTSLNMPGCVMASNDTGSRSVAMSGSVILTLQDIYTAGGIAQSGSVTEHNSSPDMTYAMPVSDPFSTLPMPLVGGCTQNNFAVSGHTQHVTMSPGVYCGNINISAQATVAMNPGIYIVKGGSFNISGGSAVTGNDVTVIYTNNADFSESGNSSMSLSAPATGTYAGILMYADRNQTQKTFSFSGDTSTNLTGIIYAPTGNITYSGGTSNIGSCTRLVAYTITFSGDSNLALNCPPGYPIISIPGAPPANITLKE